MSLTTLELKTISRGIAAAKALLALTEELHELNDLYESGSGSVKESITAKGQGALDAESQFSGLTLTQLNDGMYAAEATARSAIESARVALTVLACRGN